MPELDIGKAKKLMPEASVTTPAVAWKDVDALCKSQEVYPHNSLLGRTQPRSRKADCCLWTDKDVYEVDNSFRHDHMKRSGLETFCADMATA